MTHFLTTVLLLYSESTQVTCPPRAGRQLGREPFRNRNRPGIQGPELPQKQPVPLKTRQRLQCGARSRITKEGLHHGAERHEPNLGGPHGPTAGFDLRLTADALVRRPSLKRNQNDLSDFDGSGPPRGDASRHRVVRCPPHGEWLDRGGFQPRPSGAEERSIDLTHRRAERPADAGGPTLAELDLTRARNIIQLRLWLANLIVDRSTQGPLGRNRPRRRQGRALG
jgi:hypothetical protein